MSYLYFVAKTSLVFHEYLNTQALSNTLSLVLQNCIESCSNCETGKGVSLWDLSSKLHQILRFCSFYFCSSSCVFAVIVISHSCSSSYSYSLFCILLTCRPFYFNNPFLGHFLVYLLFIALIFFTISSYSTLRYSYFIFVLLRSYSQSYFSSSIPSLYSTSPFARSSLNFFYLSSPSL